MCPRFTYGETIGSPTHIPRGVYHLDLAVLVLFCNLIELPFFFFTITHKRLGGSAGCSLQPFLTCSNKWASVNKQP